VLKDVAMISVGGGFRDTLVRSDLVSLDSIVPASNGFTTMSTSAPNIWVSADHQVIERDVRYLTKTSVSCGVIRLLKWWPNPC
jgi:glycosylphosphatidylinositol deacylase